MAWSEAELRYPGCEPGVRRVAKIFEVKFPVPIIRVPEDAAGCFELPVGSPIDHVVEGRRHIAEPIFERRSFGGLIGENETAIIGYARNM